MLAKKIKIALGIVSKKPLTGPISVSVDLTRKCSMACVMCWYWSPLLKGEPPREWSEEHIDYRLFLELLKDFKELSVKNLIFGGQGDPFLHPDIMKIVEATKKAGIGVSLITSGSYFTSENVKKIVELRVDQLDVSVQAATPETYRKIHPALKEGVFEKIKGSLLLLKDLKKASGQAAPFLTVIDAVCSLNYKDTVRMVDFAHEVGAQNVGYKRIDVIPETRSLLLNEEQVKELGPLINEAKARAEQLGIATSLGFFRKYITPGLTSGEYTNGYYAQVPCYVGWLSSRILSDGSVIPCCGCYNPPLGNVRKDSFSAIWNSEKYRDFRERSLNILKNPGLVQNCKCYSCIDFESNLGVYRKLHPLKARKIEHE